MTTPADMEAFERWMRPLLHHPYADNWFWHDYRRTFRAWPTVEMKARGLEMRAEFFKGKR